MALTLHAMSVQALAQSCAVPGWQGQASITTAVNTYFAGSSTPSTTSIALNGGANSRRGVATNLVAGDLVLIMQMQD